MKQSLWRREGWRESVLWLGFISHYSTLIWLVIKLLSPTWIWFFGDNNCWVISPCPCLLLHFFLLCPAEEGSDRTALVGTTARSTQPNIACPWKSLFFPKKNRDFSEEGRVEDAKGKVKIKILLFCVLAHMFKIHHFWVSQAWWSVIITYFSFPILLSLKS